MFNRMYFYDLDLKNPNFVLRGGGVGKNILI